MATATATAAAVSGSSNTSTTTATSTSTTSSSSVRYARLVSVLEKTLTKSRQHFDIKKAVAEVYGDDADIFGCSTSSNNSTTSSNGSSSSNNTDDTNDDDVTSNNMLRQVFESMLDRIDEQVSEDMLQDYFVKHNVEEHFLKLEAIVEKLRLEEIYQQQSQEADKQSARHAVEGAKRPKIHLGHHAAGGSGAGGNVMATTNDVIQWQTLQEMVAQRDALQQQVEKAEAENAKLQETKAQRMQAHKEQGSKVQQLAVELDKSADVGSLFDDK